MISRSVVGCPKRSCKVEVPSVGVSYSGSENLRDWVGSRLTYPVCRPVQLFVVISFAIPKARQTTALVRVRSGSRINDTYVESVPLYRLRWHCVFPLCWLRRAGVVG